MFNRFDWFPWQSIDGVKIFFREFDYSHLANVLEYAYAIGYNNNNNNNNVCIYNAPYVMQMWIASWEASFARIVVLVLPGEMV